MGTNRTFSRVNRALSGFKWNFLQGQIGHFLGANGTLQAK